MFLHYANKYSLHFFVSNISQCHLKKVKCHFMVTDNSHITVTRQDFWHFYTHLNHSFTQNWFDLQQMVQLQASVNQWSRNGPIIKSNQDVVVYIARVFWVVTGQLLGCCGCWLSFKSFDRFVVWWLYLKIYRSYTLRFHRQAYSLGLKCRSELF